MKDLRQQLSGLNKALTRSSLAEGGRVVMFISARRGEGVSSVAASSALLAAETVRRPAWLVDLDVRSNNQFNTFAVGGMSGVFGGVGQPYSACLRQRPFFSIEPDGEDREFDPAWFTAHRVGDTRLMVTQFDSSILQENQSVRIRNRPDYWKTVRETTDWVVVDAPSIEVSGAGLVIASQMDNCVIVMNADTSIPEEVDDLRRQLEEHGGKVAGVVVNRMKPDARIADRLAR